MYTRLTKPFRHATQAMLAGVLLAGVLSGCNRSGEKISDAGIRQTGFPGQFTAGGETSGRIIARTASAAKTAPGAGPAQASQEGNRGQSPSGSVAGTPGIPEGAGGTTSGADLGGTTPGAAASKTAPSSATGTPAIPSQESRK